MIEAITGDAGLQVANSSALQQNLITASPCDLGKSLSSAVCFPQCERMGLGPLEGILCSTSLEVAVYFPGLPWWLSGQEPSCQCRRHGFDTWLGKIPWRRKWQPTPVFDWEIPWTEEPGGLQSLGVSKESDVT